MTKRNKRIIRIVILILVAILCGRCAYTNLKFETQYDQKLVSPNNVNTILIRYDYVSRPSVFLENGDKIFEYSDSGFMETIHFDVEWINDYEFILYNESVDEKYTIIIPQ